ncbi:putative ATP-dependent RNA helicase TDRD12 [Xylocopa sonorina]|uniref:putative ATP-dependent RNA helicase TDRD12 n=1 Tax=Xylocopa sonorina TaxID=1818115 RepID=UPI00403A98C9
MLPDTASIIKITNVLTPYIIRIYEMNHYDEKLDRINKKLLVKKEIFNVTEDVEPKIGDTVVVQNKLDATIDVPGWLCRGYITGIINLKDAYNIFLPDYGISIVAQREDFNLCPVDTILEDHLTFTVGLYNVLPVNVEYNSSMCNENLIISKEWSASAIEFTRELIRASDIIYFDHLVSDQHGKQYGEFYLNIKDNIICLSEALILYNYAIYLEGEVLQFMKNPMSDEKSNKEVIDETIFYLSISNMLSGNDKYKEQKESCIKKTPLKAGKKYLHHEFNRINESVLIYGVEQYNSFTSILDAKFPVEIHQAWKTLIQSSKPRKIQSYIWPAMKRGLDVVAIAAAKSGKTSGYGFAICGLLATISNLPQGTNPSALILCSSSSKVLEVNSLCTEFLQSYETIKSVAAINGKSERSLVAEMFNGCQILVSTPRFLTLFMDRNKKLLNLKNLQHLVLDDCDIILDKYFDSISKLFKKHNVIYNRELKSKMLQITVIATHWTAHLKKIASILMDNPYICIASFIEAIIFKNVRPKIYVMNSTKKNEKLLDLLGSEYLKSRTVIICRNSVEAEKLYSFLKEHKETRLAHESMNFLHLQGIKHAWDVCINGSHPILICTDIVLSDMSITNVNWLIHYSICLRSRTQFNFRFSTLLDSLQMENCNCKVTILVDEDSDIQFLHIIKILQRMNIQIPQNILENVKLIAAALESKKENYPICDKIKSWGFCDKETSCIFRHRIISMIDAPLTDIRIKDRVKFRIVSIHNATHFSARIISYIKSDTLEKIEFSNIENLQIAIKIQEYYSCAENKRKCELIELGCICGLEESVDTFKRVQILYIERENETESPKWVDVKCIDNGVILYKVNAYRLLYMPEEFIKYPPEVVEVFLVGIAPHDDEYVWNNCANDMVYQWFKENISDSSYVIGMVHLHLRNTIWVDTLEIGTKLIGYEDLIGSSLRTKLLIENHGIENDKHLSQLYQLCKNADFFKTNGCNLNV